MSETGERPLSKGDVVPYRVIKNAQDIANALIGTCLLSASRCAGSHCFDFVNVHESVWDHNDWIARVSIYTDCAWRLLGERCVFTGQEDLKRTRAGDFLDDDDNGWEDNLYLQRYEEFVKLDIHEERQVKSVAMTAGNGIVVRFKTLTLEVIPTTSSGHYENWWIMTKHPPVALYSYSDRIDLVQG